VVQAGGVEVEVKRIPVSDLSLLEERYLPAVPVFGLLVEEEVEVEVGAVEEFHRPVVADRLSYSKLEISSLFYQSTA